MKAMICGYLMSKNWGVEIIFKGNFLFSYILGKEKRSKSLTYFLKKIPYQKVGQECKGYTLISR